MWDFKRYYREKVRRSIRASQARRRADLDRAVRGLQHVEHHLAIRKDHLGNLQHWSPCRVFRIVADIN